MHSIKTTPKIDSKTLLHTLHYALLRGRYI